MTYPIARSVSRWFVALSAAAALGGCATMEMKPEGVALIEQGYYEEGLAQLQRAVADSPRDARVRMDYALQRDQVIGLLLGQAERMRADGRHDEAARLYVRVLGIDPANVRAAEGLRQYEQHRNLAVMQVHGHEALRLGDIDGAARHVAAMLELDPRHEGALVLRREVEDARNRTAVPYPQLRSKLTKPVSLEFRDASLKVIFEVLAQTAGFNFIFDKDVRPDLRATIFVRQVPVEDAVELLLVQNQLLQKIINENTIVIYPDTPQKVREYQDLTMRTFYLGNMLAKDALNLIKTMLKTRDVYIDERLNTLTMRDTADSIRLAEKLLVSQDQADPEVVLEIEVLEISRQRILDLGIQWPSTFTAVRPDGGPIQFLNQLKGIESPRRIAIPGGPVARINANDSNVNTLASPVLRVRNKETARIHIGDRVPIVSTTLTPSTGGPVQTESVTYLDTGLKIEVEPMVHTSGEVAIKVALEVSAATDAGETPLGSPLVGISTRNASTVLRLKDGETEILAGILRNDMIHSGDKIPGLGEIPGWGRLFGRNRDTHAKTELVLSITPRVVRNLPYMTPQDMEFASGTEALLRARPLMLRTAENGREAVDLTRLAESIAPGAAAPIAAATPAAPAVDPMQPTGPLTLTWGGPTELKAGEEATFVLRALAGQPMRSATLQLGFDPAVLQLVEVGEGDLLNRDGDFTSFTPRADERSGRIFIAMSRSAATGMAGEGDLFRLRVRAIEPIEDFSELRLLTFTAIGQGNRLLSTRVPPPVEFTVAP